MSWPKEVLSTIKRLNSVKRVLTDMFTSREEAINLLVLATVCQEHVLLIGPPGTAKTEIINRYTELLDLQGFHYLLTRFTEPSEIFGPLDLASFQEGTYHIRTEGMLPSAQLAFLDEVFQGGSAILNSLLTLLNERIFHNGAEKQPVPLISLIGASNFVPDDPTLHAFADRFVLRLEVNKVPDDHLSHLLEQGWELERDRIETARRIAQGKPLNEALPTVKSEDVLALHGRLLEVDLSGIQPQYVQLIQELRAEGVELSDRRVVKGLKLVAGAALLREEEAVQIPDLWPLMHLWDRPEEAEVMRTVVQAHLAEAGEEIWNPKRPVSDILLDLEALEAQSPIVHTEAALGAHLMALNKLRHEVISAHPKEQDARKKIEEAIQHGLEQMEGAYV